MKNSALWLCAVWMAALASPVLAQTSAADRRIDVTVLDEQYEPRATVAEIAVVEGWPRTGEVPASRRARVWVSPERARWAREERTVLGTLAYGAIVVEWPFKGADYLVKQVLKEAGDAAVLEPADARDAVLRAAERLLAPAS